MIYHRDMSLQLDDDAPTPGLYWLGVSVWKDPNRSNGIETPDFTLQTIADSDRYEVSPVMAVLGDIPVIDPAAELTTDQETRYDFDDGLSLTGYSLHLEADQLALQFAWEARSSTDQDYTQFIHLFDAEGNFVFGYDQPPFEDRFPTSIWPAGLRARDDWQVALPEDLPPGSYLVRTGLYNSATQLRLTVHDAAGQAVTDNSISLGMVER